MAVEVVYETHSTTLDNERGIATGWLDGTLSPAGREQAEDLGARRRDDGIAAVYASDLGRAIETAAIAFRGAGIPIHHDARLRECDYGELNGASADDVAAVRARHVDEPFRGGESYRQVVERTRDFLADVAARHDGERIVVIAHSANRWALDHLVNGTPLEELVEAQFRWQEGWLYVLNASSSASVIE
ncbi:MAG TPA: histidine phosphatase family protein [Gaiellaceae bacterium]|nr:histidine phosphatase family protein [Gaiellaceae bacterium]